MDNASIKENIRRFRKERKMTQEEMADMLCISITAYRDLERGSTSIMNSNVLRIAELMNRTHRQRRLYWDTAPSRCPARSWRRCRRNIHPG